MPLRVDVATGAAVLDAIDLRLPGPIPLVVARHYRSDRPDGAGLGRGWALGLDAWLDVTTEAVTCHGGPFDGALFAPVAPGREAHQEATGLTLQHHADALVLFAAPTRRLVFAKRGGQGTRVPLAAVQGGNGQALRLERSGGNLTEVVDPLGRRLRFSYAGDRVAAVDLLVPGGTAVPVARYRYTATGLLAEAADAEGRAERFSYGGGLLVEHVGRSGTRTFARYDAEGRCLTRWGEDGAFHLAYDPARQTTRVIDGAGGQTLFRHLGGRQVLERIPPEGARRHYYYDEAGRLAGHGTAEAVSVFQRLDPAERTLTLLDGDRVAVAAYTEAGLLASVEDALGLACALRYDERHALVGLATPSGATWVFTRDRLGRVAAVTSPEGRAVRLRWGAKDLAVEDALGERWRETWDDATRLDERIDRAGRRRRRRYDAEGRLVEIELDGAYAAEFLYDDGRLVSAADSERRRTRYRRDGSGRVERVDREAGGAVRVEYDPAGRIAALQTDHGALRLAYDTEGRIAHVDHPRRGAATYTYDGDEVVVTDARGVRRYTRLGDLIEAEAGGRGERLTFGPCGELVTREQLAGGDSLGALFFGYDADGALTEVSGLHTPPGAAAPEEVALRLAYDRDGWLLAITEAESDALRVAYDELGRPTEILAAAVRPAFDAADRLVRIEQGGREVAITYDGLDRPVAVRAGDRSVDLRAAGAAWDEPLAATGDLGLFADRRGVVLYARIGGLVLPLWARGELRAPTVDPSVRRVASVLRGPASALAAPRTAEALATEAERDLRHHPTAIPTARDLGLPWPLLGRFFLAPAMIEAGPVDVGQAPAIHDDPVREPLDGLAGPHRAGAFRPAPWSARRTSALLPPQDLIADGPPPLAALLAFLDG